MVFSPEIDVTNAIHDGENELEIHVANSLMNRMILDSQLLVENALPIHISGDSFSERRTY